MTDKKGCMKRINKLHVLGDAPCPWLALAVGCGHGTSHRTCRLNENENYTCSWAYRMTMACARHRLWAWDAAKSMYRPDTVLSGAPTIGDVNK